MREQLVHSASKYIKEFKNKIFVIKYGGSLLDDEQVSDSILEDMIVFHENYINVVLVHGGGSVISKFMHERGKQPCFIGGLRVTDRETAQIVDEALSEVNKGLVDRLRSKGVWAQSLVSREKLIIKGKRKEGAIPDDFVGDVASVDTKFIHEAIKERAIPVVSPVGVDSERNLYNINADFAAAEIAAALKAEKFILMTNVKGVLTDKEDEKSIISSLTENQALELIDKGIIAGGMIPKVKAGIAALDKGIHKAHIISGRMQHSLLLEVFTDEGVGTQIVR